MNKPILRKRSRLIYGVGVNDSDYLTEATVDGGRVRCPYYQTWKNMLKRCYLAEYQARNPPYKGCSVVDEWHAFMSFRKWMLDQNWQGKELDKDLIIEGNKIYGPDTCVFVDGKTNLLLTDSAAARGDLPIGVKRSGNRYQARCNIDGKREHLGTYATAEKAHRAYLSFKAKVIMSAALIQPDNRVFRALILRAKKMSEVSKVARR